MKCRASRFKIYGPTSGRSVRLLKSVLGYPTQKPLALLDRIIKVSSNAGDVVLDPFAGCATACVSAETLGRQWVGIDLSELAASLVKTRLREAFRMFYEVYHRDDIPKRTDLGKLPSYRTHKHQLFGKQEGRCRGCRVAFQFRNLTVDHVVPQSQGGSDHLDNLQLFVRRVQLGEGRPAPRGATSHAQRQGDLVVTKGRTLVWPGQ